MRIVASFTGSCRDFRVWIREQRAMMAKDLVAELAAGVKSGNVVSLAAYRRERKCRSKRAAVKKLFNPSIA